MISEHEMNHNQNDDDEMYSLNRNISMTLALI